MPKSSATESDMQKSMRAQLEQEAQRPHPVDEVVAKADEARERVARAEKMAAAEKGLGSPPPPRQPGKNVRRDGYSIPPEEHALLAKMEDEAMRAGVKTTKSTILRAGLHCLAKMKPAERLAALRETSPLKPGRKPQPKPDALR